MFISNKAKGSNEANSQASDCSECNISNVPLLMTSQIMFMFSMSHRKCFFFFCL